METISEALFYVTVCSVFTTLILNFTQSNILFFSYYLQILRKCFCCKISVAKSGEVLKLENARYESMKQWNNTEQTFTWQLCNVCLKRLCNLRNSLYVFGWFYNELHNFIRFENHIFKYFSYFFLEKIASKTGQ